MKLLYKIVLVFLSFSLMNSLGKYTEIEYRQKVVSKYDKKFTLFSVKFNREEGIQAQYQKGKQILEIDPETMTIVDKSGTENLKSFQLTPEELQLSPMKDLFKVFDKIEFPEETDFRSALYPDFPIWHIIVDGKDYQSNVDTPFYKKFDELVNIKNIKDYVIQKYNN